MSNKQKKEEIIHYRPTWLEIDLGAIAYNFRQVKRIVGRGVKVLAVVKADAYGHGMVAVARKLNKCGVDCFGVASIDEALTLRSTGIAKPILVFENVSVEYASRVVDNNITATITTIALARKINQCAQKAKKITKIHVKIDTGMGRLGIWHDEALAFIKKINQLSHVALEGVYTHFPSADTDRTFTQRQIAYFRRLKRALEVEGIKIPLYHTANSMGIIGYDQSHCNLVRPGLMLYGLYPKSGLSKKLTLKPAMSLKTRVMYLKDVPRGRGISYGRTFVTKRATTIATLPVGYNDGYFRLFSNRTKVLFKGKRYRVVGRVCMDQTMVDMGIRSSVSLNDVIILLGSDRVEKITAEELAVLGRTISYEIVCALGKTHNRIYRGA
ncbi:alanine racemase [Candidatus Omnitrophota bacterium]